MFQGQRILVCLRYGIGDAVMEIPALRSLRTAWPEAEIWLLGARPALELFESDPDFQALVCVQDFGFDHWGDPGDETIRDRFQCWFQDARFSLVLDPFHAVFGIQHALTHGGVPWRNASPKPTVPEQLDGGHGIQVVWHSAMESWGLASQCEGELPSQQLFIPGEAKRAAEERLRRWQRGSTKLEKLVGLAPIASSELKRWPMERVAEVIRWLVGEKPRRVLIFGMDRNDNLLSPLLRAAPDGPLLVVPPAHLQETAALAAHCEAFVSNDTGLMHMAAAVGTPTLGIFGPTAAHLYLPDHSLAVASDRECDYRLREYFGPPQCVHADRCLIATRSCIDTIPTQAVITALGQLLCDSENEFGTAATFARSKEGA